jgi:transposase InsO family protein
VLPRSSPCPGTPILPETADSPTRAVSSPDNGTCFKRRWSNACAQHQIGVRKTRPYRPQTNGKAERFIRTLLERWAYAYSYDNEAARSTVLPHALDFYNCLRPHRALGGQTPLQRVNNLSGTNT